MNFQLKVCRLSRSFIIENRAETSKLKNFKRESMYKAKPNFQLLISFMKFNCKAEYIDYKDGEKIVIDFDFLKFCF